MKKQKHIKIGGVGIDISLPLDIPHPYFEAHLCR